MKKIVTLILEVDTDYSDEFIKNDLMREIYCACNMYELLSITIETKGENKNGKNNQE